MKTEIYWIDESLAILMRPRGGDWLEDEIRDLLGEGVNILVSLLAQDEVAELDLELEAAVCEASGLAFYRLPINDLSVPSSMLATIKLVKTLSTLQTEGKKIGIHCRQGLGRAPLIAACLLVKAGIAPEAAWQKISQARGTAVPETEEQRDWLNRFAEELQSLNS